MCNASAAARDHVRTFDRKVAIGPPNLTDAQLPEEYQAGGVDVRQLVPAQSLQLAPNGCVMAGIERE